VPDSLGAIKPVLERCLQPDPTARPDATELVQSLLAAARELDRPAPLPLVGLDLHDDDAASPVDDDATVLPTRANVDMTMHAGGAPVAEARPRRHWWRWLLALLVLAAIGVGAALLWTASQPPSAVVPNVAGQVVSEAEAAIEAARVAGDEPVAWDVQTKDEFSDGVDAGVVIRTEPAGGTDLDDESVLTLIVSKGPEPVPVPSLVDIDEATARARIEEAELTVGTVTPEFSETIAAGLVTGWSVDGVEKPSESPKGSPVDFRVSQGPEPRTVPELAGAPREDAEAELAELGLSVDSREEFSDDVEAGMVIGTDPPAGEQVGRGETVTLIVSKGPDLVEVPDVVGMRFSDAYDKLTAAGFKVADEGEGNNVVGTDPEGGTMARRGSTVTIERRR
jgi:serine/threonine-protein kinase